MRASTPAGSVFAFSALRVSAATDAPPCNNPRVTAPPTVPVAPRTNTFIRPPLL